jgi:hypothetical protein
MATSGTTAFTLDLLEIVEEAFERCGSEARSGYDLRTARRSINLLFADWANRGVNLWTMDAGSIVLTAGLASYTLPTDTVDVLDCVLRINDGVATSQNDRPLVRISNSVYSSITNKLTPGTPNQIAVARGTATPTVTLYPVPNAANMKLVYWRLRRIQDVTGGADNGDIPFRLLPAFASGLAYYLAFKVPGAAPLIPTLKAVYDEDWQRAADEDREKSSVRLVPRRARL